MNFKKGDMSITNFELPKEKYEWFFEVFPLREPGLVYTDSKIYRLPPIMEKKEVKSPN